MKQEFTDLHDEAASAASDRKGVHIWRRALASDGKRDIDAGDSGRYLHGSALEPVDAGNLHNHLPEQTAPPALPAVIAPEQKMSGSGA